jgi:F-type H+-transporting ATPase subunit b
MMSIRLAVVLAGILAAALADPSIAAAAAEGGSGDKWGVWLTIGRFFNLAVLIGVLVWVGRRPLSSFFAARTRGIHEQLAQAETARRAAEAKLAEMEARMGGLDGELRELKATAEREAQAESARLAAEAERDAQKIVARARQEIEGLTRVAQLELKAHAAELSVELAERMLRSEIDDADRGRLFERFVDGLPAKGGR